MILNNIFNSCKRLKYLLSKNLLIKLFRGNSKYIIRLDDACETMNLKKWKKIESILDELKIKPIVAVIPSNKDETLYLDQKISNFWELIFSWQKKGWEIARMAMNTNIIKSNEMISFFLYMREVNLQP